MADDDEAAEAAGEALERSLLRATRAVESELTRVTRTGEADVERLARTIAEALAKLALEGAFNTAAPAPQQGEAAGGASSVNQIAAAVARAAFRGARFS